MRHEHSKQVVDFCFLKSFKKGASNSISGTPYVIGQDAVKKSLLAFRL